MIVSTLVLCAALGLPANQTGDLKLNNIRATHGLLGPKRTEKSVLPGDTVFVCFDIDGITVNPDGKVKYDITTEITDAKGTSVSKEEKRNLEMPLSLGGSSVPGFSQIDCGLAQPAGEYNLKLTVVDRSNNKTATFSHKFAIAPAGFGLVRFSTTHDQEGRYPSNVAGAGEALWLHCGVVGFDRDKTSKQPQVSVELQVLDEQGKQVGKTQSGVIGKDVPDNVAMVPLQFLLSLNRGGKFTMVVTATDQLSKKTTKTTLPLNVLEAK